MIHQNAAATIILVLVSNTTDPKATLSNIHSGPGRGETRGHDAAAAAEAQVQIPHSFSNCKIFQAQL